MKLSFLFQLFSFLLSTIIWTGCEPSQTLGPGVAIYKTNGDYFNLVDIGVKGDRIFRRSSFSKDHSKLLISNGDTVYKHRAKLIQGYVLDFEADERYDVFLNLSFKQHLILEKTYNLPTLPDDTLNNHILDKTPYLEFFRENENHERFSLKDTVELNSLIKQNKLEEYFTRIK